MTTHFRHDFHKRIELMHAMVESAFLTAGMVISTLLALVILYAAISLAER